MPNPNRSKVAIVIAVVIALILIGVGLWVWFSGVLKPEAAPAPPAIEVQLGVPTNLKQLGGETDIEAGKSTNATKPTFSFEFQTDANRGSLVPEVEVQKVGTAFTGTPTTTGSVVAADGNTMQFRVESSELAAGGYRWQARLSKDGAPSDWVVFGADTSLESSTPPAIDAVAFIIDMNAPTAPGITTIGEVKASADTSVTTPRPKITGTSEADAGINITIGPENTKLSAKSDATGAWSAEPTTDISSGKHQISVVATDEAGNASQPTAINLTIGSAVAAAPAAPTPAATPPAATATSTPAVTPTQPQQLAATGENASTISLLSLIALLASGGGLIWVRRHAPRY